jgi:hypothetical protein
LACSNNLVIKVFGVSHGDFCSCVSGYRKPTSWSPALLSHTPPLPSILPLSNQMGHSIVWLFLNFRILYLPKAKLKSGSDCYIPLQDNAENRCDLPCRLFPQMGGWIRLRSTYGRPHLSYVCVCQTPRLLCRFHATQFPCNSLVINSSSTFLSTPLPSSCQ